ncbi:MAG: hypothetical protein WBY22_11770 [Nitrososphaeraceae archaeon]|jgi:hypothetical protein
MAQNDSVDRLQELGFEIISITKDVLVCKLDPKDPKSDNGRWIDLSINEERCRALHRAGTIVFLKVEGITDATPRRIDEKPHFHIELRRYAYR